MSKYEDYSEVSKVYDKERKAMGADIIAGLLHVYGKKPLKVSQSLALWVKISAYDIFKYFFFFFFPENRF